MATLPRQAAATLREQILTGRLPKGARLTERSLAEELDISPTPVREALQQLQHEGLVEMVPRVGTFVRHTSPARVLELFEVREALESKAAELLAGRATETELAVLERLAERRDCPRPDDDRPEFHRAERQFHEFVLDHCGNEELARSVRTLDMLGQCLAWTTFFREPEEQRVPTDPDHREIVAAIASGDPERAAQTIGQHIRHAAKKVAMAAALKLQETECPESMSG